MLPLNGGTAPDASGTGNASARPEKIVSTATQTANSPKLSFVQLLFDQTTDQHWMWNFQLPSDFGSGGTVKLLWGAKVTSGIIIWKAAIAVGVTSSTDLDAAVFLTVALSGAGTVPGTVGQCKESIITPAMTGATVGCWLTVMVGRDAENGFDTAAGDGTISAVTFEYQTT